MAARLYRHLAERGFELRFVNDQLRIAPADRLTDRDREHLATHGGELKAFTAAIVAGDMIAARRLDFATHYLKAFDFETGRPRCTCGRIAPADGCHVCEQCAADRYVASTQHLDEACARSNGTLAHHLDETARSNGKPASHLDEACALSNASLTMHLDEAAP